MSMPLPRGSWSQCRSSNHEQPTAIDYVNNSVVRTAYYALCSRLTSIAAPSVSLSYLYFPNNSISQITDGTQSTSFTYDPLDRLKTASGEYSASYSYDQIGNITSKTEGGTSHSLDFPGSGHKHAPRLVDGNQQTYDANGNLTARSGLSLQYDAENRMVKVSNAAGYVARFIYDGDGKRVKRVDNNGTVIYAGPHYERNVGNGVDTSDTVAKMYWAQLGSVSRLVAVRKGGVLSYLHHDHLGTTKKLSSDSTAFKYYPYGSTIQEPASPPTENLYTGQKRDGYINLYFMGARYYDQELGRFISPDTIVPDPGNPQALNRYSYGYNNPLRYTDPSGHDPIDSAWEGQFEADNGRKPTDDDRLDRLYSYSTRRAWTTKNWQDYAAAKKAGTVNPRSVLAGTRGSMEERLKIASGLVMLKMSGPRGAAVYNSITQGGTIIRFNGGPVPVFIPGLHPMHWPSLGKPSAVSVGYANVVYLDESLMNDSAEAVAANVAHEAYHAQRAVPRYPWTRSEEVQAYTQEAQVWEELRVSYKGPR